MIKGLETHDAALVKAAADGFHANAADVSGNNVPLNGGTFNADGTTVASALSTATGPLPPAPVSPLTPASPAASGGADHSHDQPAPTTTGAPAAPPTPPSTPAPAPTPASTPVAANAGDHHDAAPCCCPCSHEAEMAQHLHHMWG
jgi:hypothetical protein